ncbi:unnamed protein product [Rotaria magnacalcarata]|nr:unnamed protein product [Rotaria magnacalcarata]
MSDEENSMNRINILLNMINQCEQCVNQVENISNLFFLQQIFDELKRNYNKEYKKYRLWDLEGSVLHGYLKEHLTSNWNIYDDDQELIDLFWK